MKGCKREQRECGVVGNMGNNMISFICFSFNFHLLGQKEFKETVYKGHLNGKKHKKAQKSTKDMEINKEKTSNLRREIIFYEFQDPQILHRVVGGDHHQHQEQHREEAGHDLV